MSFSQISPASTSITKSSLSRSRSHEGKSDRSMVKFGMARGTEQPLVAMVVAPGSAGVINGSSGDGVVEGVAEISVSLSVNMGGSSGGMR